MQTGYPAQNQSFQQPSYPQAGFSPQAGFPGQRPPFQQPQQTGFLGAVPAMVPQQTGFSSYFQPQHRPPVPPVPPLSS